MRRGLVVALTAVLAVSGFPAHAAPPVGQSALGWNDCLDLDSHGQAGLECATLEVPLDHTGATQGTLRLAVARVSARATAEATLVVHPGGPGTPGRQWAGIVAERLPADLRDTVDVVAFDPRGVGLSEPALECDPGYFDPVRPDSVPGGDHDIRTLLLRSARYTVACTRENGALLRYMRTEDSVHDTDALRAALGAEQIDYLGYSYGTYVGASYATLYPERLRRLVLDSVVDPRGGWYDQTRRQIRSLDAAAGSFFDWVARHDDAYGLGDSAEEVGGAYYEARNRLAAEPLEAAVGPAEFDGTFAAAAYTDSSWPALAQALAEYVLDDAPGELLRVHAALGEDAGSDPGFAGYLATKCTDSSWPRDSDIWLAEGQRAHSEAPFQAWNSIWYNAACLLWPFDGGFWLQAHGFETDDALLVQAAQDGPTPAEGAFAMRDRFPDSRLILEEDGVAHGVSLRGNACVDDAVAAYLRDGRLPAAGGGVGEPDLTCASLPEPEPAEPRAAPNPLNFDLRVGRHGEDPAE